MSASLTSHGLDQFAALLKDASPPLLASALAIAQDRYPGLRTADWLAQFAELTARLTRRVPDDASALHRLRLLNHYFFEELGFRGNDKDYSDPDNSYLNRVLERRTGLPIALSVLYIEIGSALGLRMAGLSFPGHFLVHLSTTTGDLIIDVFDQGKTLSLEDLRARLAALGVEQTPVESYLRDAATREILARMLRNLKNVYGKRQDWPALLAVQNRLVMVLPEAAQERRDRGAIYLKLECPRAAAEDFIAYLSTTASPPDEADVRAQLAAAQAAASALN
jgi:regulator of sirC expression with transglutaminase-like and TPR domain